jgi:patatin-like phospholipase/acyl hydrolase
VSLLTSYPSLSVADGGLTIDGGGIRGVSELIILDEIMKRVQHDMKLMDLPRPCDYFHLIGGTSTGG